MTEDANSDGKNSWIKDELFFFREIYLTTMLYLWNSNSDIS